MTDAERVELRSLALSFMQHVCRRAQALWARFDANVARADAGMAEAIEEPSSRGQPATWSSILASRPPPAATS